MGSSPCGPDTPRPYSRALCAPQSDINPGQPCSFTAVPDGAHTWNINGLRVIERNPGILFFSLKSPGKRTPCRFPNRAPIKREARLQDILYISQKPHLSSCILYIYSTNIGTEYFKHGIYSPSFSSSKCSLFHNSNVFGSCIIVVVPHR